MSVSAQSSSFRLSPQQALALGRLHAPAVVQCAIELVSPVDEAALVESLRKVVARHESLRTTFATPAGARAPVAQTVHDELEPAFSRAQAPADESGLDAVLAAEAGRLDLAAGPSLRALLLDGSDQPLLVLSAPAACTDATSLAMVVQELRAEAEPDPEAEPIQHADYAEWRHELRDGEDPDTPQGIAFWTAATAEAPPRAPILFGAPAAGPAQTHARTPVEVDEALLSRLTTAAQRSRVSLETLLHGAWLALLFRLSGAEELATARLGDGRSQPDLADAIGPYAQPLPVRAAIEAETSFPELLDRVARASALAERWQDYATDGELATVSGAATAGFVFAPTAGLRRLSLGTTAAGLELAIAEEGDAELRYDPAAYDERDAREIAAGLLALLNAVADDPAGPVAGLPVASAERRAELLAAAAGPAPTGERTPIHVRVQRQAEATPDAPAVVGGEVTLSYREFDEAATRLAHELRARGADRDAPVAICLPRTPAALVAVLAAMKAGSGYLPLHREHPPARLAHQLTESGARVVVTELDLLDRLPPLESTAVVCVDRDASAIAAHPPTGLGVTAPGEDIAYVMYTSGSTGLPKGVAVTHANLANYTDAVVERVGAEPGWQYALVSELSTDLGNTAVFPALATGGTVHLIEPRTAMDGLAFSAYAERHALDVMKITPTHLRALLGGGRGFLPRRWLVLGGEALSWRLVDEVRSSGASCRVLNHYGPTETTIGATTFEVPDAPTPSATVPIGRALAGARAYVLDGGLEPVPDGVPGELCLGGAGVARGYVGRPEETAARFVPDPSGGRMYRTGDRVRRHRDGAIEFLGRVDQQVKIRGYRVEPGEIEAALARHPGVREAAVLAHAPEGEEARLVAYVVAPDAPVVAELPAFLGETLPEYMIPSRWVPIDVIPLTPSGKIDRRALPDPDTVPSGRTDAFVAPRDDLERDIAAIWAELLGLPEVGVTDDFFALGGHSLLATQAIMRIRRAFGDIPLGALFNAPTVAALAETIRARSGTQSAGR
jgi:amino acid adenylation domain-containing protein